LALRQRTTGTGHVVAHGAVDAEQLATCGEVAVALKVTLVGDRGSGGERGDPRGERRDLLVRELHGLHLSLRTGGGHGHAARADLEVDGCRTHADEAGPVGR